MERSPSLIIGSDSLAGGFLESRSPRDFSYVIAVLLAAIGVSAGFRPQSACAAALEAVQSGSTSLPGGSSTTTVTISSVDPATSFLVFSARLSDESPENGQVSGQIQDATTLAFERSATSGTVTIEWYVAEFSSGVTVQRGAQALSGTSTNASIASVDLARSFPITTYRTSGVTYDGNDFVEATLTSSTNLSLTTNSGVAGGAVVEWQVVQVDDANVQSGGVSFGTGDDTQTASPSAFDPSTSWLVYSYRCDAGSNSDIGRRLVRGLITDGTTLTFDRENTGHALDLSWYLIEFTDGTSVQHGSAGFGTSSTVTDIPIAAIDPANTVAAAGHWMRGGKSPYSGGDNPGVAWVTTEFLSDTSLRLTRDFTGSSTADVGWFVVSFAGSNTQPLVSSAIPDTAVAEDSPPVDNYRDLNDVFGDTEEGSALTFAVQSNSNPGLVTVSVDADSALDLSFAAGQTGMATVTIRATDSGALWVEDTFIVSVVNNFPPIVVSPIPDTTLAMNSYPVTKYRDLNDVFWDVEDGSMLAFIETANSNPGVVDVTLAPDSSIGLEVVPDQVGSATIVFRAVDASLVLSVEDTFVVSVIDMGGPPVVANAIPDTMVEVDSPPANNYRDLNDVFFDAEDGGALAFTIEANSNPTLLSATVDPDSSLDLSFTPALSGEAELVIRATDSSNFHVEDTLLVTVTPVQTGIDDDGVPPATVLHPNYPNPFNPATTIRYDLSESGHVTLRIYNLRGEEVRTLVDTDQPAGYKAVVWRGEDNGGRRVSSGVYFYQLRAGGFAATRKLVFLK